MKSYFNFILVLISSTSGNGSEQIFNVEIFLQNGDPTSKLMPDYVMFLQLEILKDLTCCILSQLAKKIRKLSPKFMLSNDIEACFNFDFSIIIDSSSSLTI